MKTEIFTIFDMAVDRFMDPFPAPTIEFAIREFRGPCSTEGHQFNKFPEDYALYHVATWDNELGEMEPLKPRKVAMASSFAREIDKEMAE